MVEGRKAVLCPLQNIKMISEMQLFYCSCMDSGPKATLLI